MKWERTILGDIAEFKNGLNFNKDQYGEGVKYISVADFQDYFSVKSNDQVLGASAENFMGAFGSSLNSFNCNCHQPTFFHCPNL